MLELTVVIVVMGTAAAVAVPRFMNSTKRSRLQAAAQRLAQDIEVSRERARTLGVYQTFYFSTDGYIIMDRTATTEVKRMVTLSDDPYDCTIGWVALKTGTDFSFDGFGVPSTSAIVKITNGTDAYLVSIAAGSGAVTASGRLDPTAAATADASVTPTAIAAEVDSVTPAPRVNTKVRFTVPLVNVNVNVANLIEVGPN